MLFLSSEALKNLKSFPRQAKSHDIPSMVSWILFTSNLLSYPQLCPIIIKRKEMCPSIYIYIYADIQTLIQSVIQEFAVKAIKH